MDKETIKFCKNVFHLIRNKSVDITDSDIVRSHAVSMEDVYWILHSCNPEQRLTCILDDATQVVRQERVDDIIKGVCKELGIKDSSGGYWSDDVADIVNELVPVIYDKSSLLAKRYKVNIFIDLPDGGGGWEGMKSTARFLDKLLSITCKSKYEDHALHDIFSEDSLKRYDDNTSVVLTVNFELSTIIWFAQKMTEAGGNEHTMRMGVRDFHLGIYDFGTRLYRGAVFRDTDIIIPMQSVKGTYLNDLGFKHQPINSNDLDPAYPILTKSKHVPKTMVYFY